MEVCLWWWNMRIYSLSLLPALETCSDSLYALPSSLCQLTLALCNYKPKWSFWFLKLLFLMAFGHSNRKGVNMTRSIHLLLSWHKASGMLGNSRFRPRPWQPVIYPLRQRFYITRLANLILPIISLPYDIRKGKCINKPWENSDLFLVFPNFSNPEFMNNHYHHHLAYILY